MWRTRRISTLLMTTALLAIVGVAPPAGRAQSASGQVPVLSPGVHNQRFARTGETEVRYTISIPKDYSPTRPVPLVLALHFGGNPNGAGAGLLRVLVGPAFADLGAVIVAPDSISGGWSTPENERAVMALLDAVEESYRTDPKRVVVTGFSMGGAGVWFIAGKYPDRFSAAVPVAGRPPASMDGWRTPVLAVHSKADEVVPFGPTEARIQELRKARVRAELITVTGITHYETHRFADALERAVPWLRATWRSQ